MQAVRVKSTKANGWHPTPGGMREESRGKARLYDAAVPSYLSHNNGNYLKEVVRYRGEANQGKRKRQLNASKLVSSHLENGREVLVKGYGPGVLLYSGPVKGSKGTRAGIALLDPIDGAGDGCCQGTRYFECPPGHAVFVDVTDVSLLWRGETQSQALPTDGAGKWDGRCYVYPGANVYGRHSFVHDDHLKQLERDKRAQENRNDKMAKMRARLTEMDNRRNDTNSKFHDRYSAQQEERLNKVLAKNDAIKNIRNDRVEVYYSAHFPKVAEHMQQQQQQPPHGEDGKTPVSVGGGASVVDAARLDQLRRALAARQQYLLSGQMPSAPPQANLPPILARLRGGGGEDTAALAAEDPLVELRTAHPMYAQAEALAYGAQGYSGVPAPVGGGGVPRPARLAPIHQQQQQQQHPRGGGGFPHGVPMPRGPSGDVATNPMLRGYYEHQARLLQTQLEGRGGGGRGGGASDAPSPVSEQPFDTRMVVRVNDAHYMQGPHLQSVVAHKTNRSGQQRQAATSSTLGLAPPLLPSPSISAQGGGPFAAPVVGRGAPQQASQSVGGGSSIRGRGAGRGGGGARPKAVSPVPRPAPPQQQQQQQQQMHYHQFQQQQQQQPHARAALPPLARGGVVADEGDPASLAPSYMDTDKESQCHGGRGHAYNDGGGYGYGYAPSSALSDVPSTCPTNAQWSQDHVVVAPQRVHMHASGAGGVSGGHVGDTSPPPPQGRSYAFTTGPGALSPQTQPRQPPAPMDGGNHLNEHPANANRASRQQVSPSQHAPEITEASPPYEYATYPPPLSPEHTRARPQETGFAGADGQHPAHPQMKVVKAMREPAATAVDVVVNANDTDAEEEGAGPSPAAAATGQHPVEGARAPRGAAGDAEAADDALPGGAHDDDHHQHPAAQPVASPRGPVSGPVQGAHEHTVPVTSSPHSPPVATAIPVPALAATRQEALSEATATPRPPGEEEGADGSDGGETQLVASPRGCAASPPPPPGEEEEGEVVVVDATPARPERSGSIFEMYAPLKILVDLQDAEDDARRALIMEQLCVFKCHIEKEFVWGMPACAGGVERRDEDETSAAAEAVASVDADAAADVEGVAEELLHELEIEERLARQTYTLEEQCGFASVEARWERRGDDSLSPASSPCGTPP